MLNESEQTNKLVNIVLTKHLGFYKGFFVVLC